MKNNMEENGNEMNNQTENIKNDQEFNNSENEQIENNQEANWEQNPYVQEAQANAKQPEVKEESNFRLILYIILMFVIFFIILLLMRSCNGLRNRNKNQVLETNDWVTNMWNKCVDPVYWYVVDGTGVNGADINIDSVLVDCDTYYNEYKSKSNTITSLGDEYAEFKEYFKGISDQIEIIYPKIKANKPVAQAGADYEENMETFYDYQVKLYNLVKEKYADK